MIKTQELKTQIEQLTKQHDEVLTELRRMKHKLNDMEEISEHKHHDIPTPIWFQLPQQQQESLTDRTKPSQLNPNMISSMNASSPSSLQSSTQFPFYQSTLPSNNGNINGNPLMQVNDGIPQFNMKQNQIQYTQCTQTPSQTNDNQAKDIKKPLTPTQQSQMKELANELLKIKNMVERLEQKTKHVVSDQTQNQFAEKDVVHLVMVLMQGMTEWASEYVIAATNQN
jgi:hypothetical protein